MESFTIKKAKQALIGRYPDWIKRFDVNEYVQNPAMIEKLYEEKQFALVQSIEYEEQLKQIEKSNHELILQNQRLLIEVNEASRRSSLLFALSILATILIGIGVNIVTISQNDWKGWVMIVFACLLECTAFLARPKRSKK